MVRSKYRIPPPNDNWPQLDCAVSALWSTAPDARHLLSQIRDAPQPQVGMGVTVLAWRLWQPDSIDEAKAAFWRVGSA